jgi:hypothetical protein
LPFLTNRKAIITDVGEPHSRPQARLSLSAAGHTDDLRFLVV